MCLREGSPLSAGGLLPTEGSRASPSRRECTRERSSVRGLSGHMCPGAPGRSPRPARGGGRAARPGSGQASGPGACSEVGAALEQGGDGVLQGHGHLLGGLAQQRAVGVVLLQVQDVALLALRRAAALLTHVQLGPPLLVRVLLLHAVDLLEVGLQGAALREGLVAQAAFVGPHACGGTAPVSGSPQEACERPPQRTEDRPPDPGQKEQRRPVLSPAPWGPEPRRGGLPA